MKSLLVATDLTALSDRAVDRAVRLAARFGAELTVLHVVNNALDEKMRRDQHANATEVVRRQLAAAPSGQKVAAKVEISDGDDFAEIIRAARSTDADAIVLGMHRKQGLKDLFVGTTMERVLRFADRPVLVVKDPAAQPYEQVLVPVDFSVPSRRALALACRFVPAGDFRVVHAYHVPFAGFITDKAARREAEAEHQRRLEAMVSDEMALLLGQVAGTPIKVTSTVHAGAIMQVIQDQVRSLEPDLLVMGTHGRTGLAQAMLGSVALEIMADPPCDVLTIGAW